VRAAARRSQPQTLIYGYGNPGRSDDGLGPALVARLEEAKGFRPLGGFQTETRLQLNIEDALTVSRFDRVIFVDAARRGPDPYEFSEIQPAAGWAFSTHELAPESVLALCAELYSRKPRAFLLAVRGHRWVLGESLSPKAEKNLGRAIAFLERELDRPSRRKAG
jgi:hydrogenase maturation protease